MGLSLIVAFDKNRVIGKGVELPFRQKADLRRVKELTTGQTIIMGRKTFESLGNRPLPNRKNIVLVRDIENKHSEHSNLVFLSWEYLDRLEEFIDTEEAFVFGGALTYKKLLPLVNKFYLTEIFGEVKGDDLVYFPEIDFSEWKLEEESEVFSADEENEFDWQYKIFKRDLRW